MLDFIRQRAQGWFAWVIVIAIIVPFALWGIQQYFSGGREVSVATVNGTDISQARLQVAYLQQRQRLQEMFGENFNPAMFPEERMKGQILDDLIRNQLILQAAVASDMRISNEQLATAIGDIDAFRVDGKFSADRYRQLLRSRGMSPAQFEQDMRRDLLTRQYYEGFADSTFVTDFQIDSYMRIQGQTRDFGYLVLPRERFVNQVKVDAQQVADYYETNQERWRVPEQVRVDYLELNIDDIAAKFTIAQDELRQRYEAEKDNFRTPEQRRASHILIAVSSANGSEADQQAKAKAEQLLVEIRGGASFAELAKANSEDPGSASQGGDLGFFGRGVMDPAFEKAVFALQPGAVSEPVRSAYGYHLIKLDAIQGGDAKSFDEVSDQLLQEARREHAEKDFYELADKLANLTYEHPDTLDVAAQELGLNKQSSPYFNANNGSGIFSNAKIRAAAFGEDVLQRDHNSEVVEIDNKHLVVLRLNDHKPSQLRPMDEVKSQIETIIKNERAGELAGETADQWLESLRIGADPAKLAKREKLDWQRFESASRDQQGVDAAVRRQVFKMARPAAEPALQRVRTGTGEAVIVLYSVKDGAIDRSDDKGRGESRDQLRSALADANFNATVATLQAGASISRSGK